MKKYKLTVNADRLTALEILRIIGAANGKCDLRYEFVPIHAVDNNSHDVLHVETDDMKTFNDVKSYLNRLRTDYGFYNSLYNVVNM